MIIKNRDHYPDAIFPDESEFLEIGTRSDGAKIIQVGKEGDAPIVALAYTNNPLQEELSAIELWSLMKFSQDSDEFSFYSSPIRLDRNIRLIYKHKIPRQGQFSLDLDIDAEILTVQLQNTDLCLWTLSDPKSTKCRNNFVWIRTGEEIEHKSINYVKTVQIDDGKKVIHLFKLGLDCSHLEDLLAKERWREADLETFRILEQLCGAEDLPDKKIISQSGANIISPSDLQAIDKLWLQYSNGHFGYSAQILITHEIDDFWENAGEKVSSWKILCARLGWNQAFPALDFSLKAPKGHLPAIIGWGMGFGPLGGEEIYRTLWSRVNTNK
jgi:hypothetical protein